MSYCNISDEEAELVWSSAILDLERRIMLVPLKVKPNGEVVETLDGLNRQFDESDWDETKESWVRWLKDRYDHLDYFQREYLGEETG